MSFTLQQLWNMNPLHQWEQYFNNMGPVGKKAMTVNCNHPGYVAFGPLPVDSVNPRHYNPNGDLYYTRPNFYDPLGNLQTVPQVAARRPITCCNYTGVCEYGKI
jgi:hypothetical protein